MAGAIKRQGDNGGARHPQDKFYTNPEVATTCLRSLIPFLDVADIVVEPSAGSGSFSKQIQHPSLLALDLHPEDETILEQDWFQVSRGQLGEGSLLIVGNPPFGVRSDLAKRFIQHAVTLEAETIAFILPATFSKALNQQENLFPARYRLVVEETLPASSFILDGESFHIPCRWFVWTSTELFAGVDLRKTLHRSHPDFTFLPRGSAHADFTLNGNSGKVKVPEEVTNPKAEHYIQVTNPAQLEQVRLRFQQLPLDFHSSVNGGVSWVGKQEILSAYYALTA